MPAEELAKRYTLAGLEYDEVITVGEEFSGVVVAKVLSCDKVEKSDHLHICQVDIGAAEPLNIICGAPNVREGLLVACAKVGAVLPGDFEISARKTFGYLSDKDTTFEEYTTIELLSVAMLIVITLKKIWKAWST